MFGFNFGKKNKSGEKVTVKNAETVDIDVTCDGSDIADMNGDWLKKVREEYDGNIKRALKNKLYERYKVKDKDYLAIGCGTVYERDARLVDAIIDDMFNQLGFGVSDEMMKSVSDCIKSGEKFFYTVGNKEYELSCESGRMSAEAYIEAILRERFPDLNIKAKTYNVCKPQNIRLQSRHIISIKVNESTTYAFLYGFFKHGITEEDLVDGAERMLSGGSNESR